MTKRKSLIISRPAIIPAPESRVGAFAGGARRPERRVMSRRILSILLLAACVDPPEDELAETSQEIANPVSVAANQLLGVVRVSGTQGSCSGTLIAADSVLTAAHCFCTVSFVGGNDCGSAATVTFRPDPNNPNATTVTRTGTARVMSGYNPSWIQNVIIDDLAVITLNGVAPPYAQPIRVAQTYLPIGTLAFDAGYGRTGPNCDGASGVLFTGSSLVSGYESAYHDREAMRFDSRLFCKGDSGGPVLSSLDPSTMRVHGVNSAERPDDSNLATTTTQHFNWITGNVCRSSISNRCTGWGDPCNCTARNEIVWRSTSGALSVWFMANGVLTGSTSPSALGDPYQLQGSGDFDGDGHGDLLWRHMGTGRVLLATMRDGVITSYTSPGTPDLGWRIDGVADFNRDGRGDVFWRHTSGQTSIWFSGQVGNGAGPGFVDPAWRAVGFGDFNKDGFSDILWRNGQALSIWLMNGASPIGFLSPPNVAWGWSLQGIADLDGNLASDLVWRNTDGTVSVWFDGDAGKGGAPSSGNTGAPFPSNFVILGMADFDFDGRDDILWREGSTGQLIVWIMDGAFVSAEMYPGFVDGSWSVKAIAHDRGF
jgi:hypothetical protein